MQYTEVHPVIVRSFMWIDCVHCVPVRVVAVMLMLENVLYFTIQPPLCRLMLEALTSLLTAEGVFVVYCAALLYRLNCSCIICQFLCDVRLITAAVCWFLICCVYANRLV